MVLLVLDDVFVSFTNFGERSDVCVEFLADLKCFGKLSGTFREDCC